MRLQIENVSKITKADIKLEGITVIAGSNNSGKSTVGKVLYAINDIFFNKEQYIQEQKPNDAKLILKRKSEDLDILCKKRSGAKRRKVTLAEPIQDKYKYFFAQCDDQQRCYDKMRQYCAEHMKLYGLEFMAFDYDIDRWIEDASNEMMDNMINFDSTYIEETAAMASFQSVFGKQVIKGCRKDEKSEKKKAVITLEENYVKNRNDLKKNVVIAESDNKYKLKQDYAVNSNALFLDSPQIFDKILSVMQSPFANKTMIDDVIRKHFSPKRVEAPYFIGFSSWMRPNMGLYGNYMDQEQISSSEQKKMDEITQKIDKDLNELLGGEFCENEGTGNPEFRDIHYDSPISAENLSTGVKAFTLLQMLLHHRMLKKGTILILDEPEVNLHPEWQIRYAKYVSLLQKELELTVLITTHSPFFLKAIENASYDYENDENTHYYYAQNVNGDAEIRCVDDDIEEIYHKMMMPLYELMDGMGV